MSIMDVMKPTIYCKMYEIGKCTLYSNYELRSSNFKTKSNIHARLEYAYADALPPFSVPHPIPNNFFIVRAATLSSRKRIVPFTIRLPSFKFHSSSLPPWPPGHGNKNWRRRKVRRRGRMKKQSATTLRRKEKESPKIRFTRIAVK